MPTIIKISKEQFYKSTSPGIYINSGQPGAGRKTSGFNEYVVEDSKTDEEKNVKRIGFFSANHKHLYEVENKLEQKGIPCVHLEGWTRLCDYSDDPDYLEMYNTIQSPKETVCKECLDKDDCQFITQYKELDNSEVKVVLAPLELMHDEKITSTLSMLYVDESADKTTIYNIGHKTDKFEKFKVEMLKISDKPDFDKDLLMIVEHAVYEVKTRVLYLQNHSILYCRPEEELKQIDNTIYAKKEFKTIIQNGKWITHIEPVHLDKIWNQLTESSRTCISNENNTLNKLIWRVKKAIKKGGIGSPIVQNYVDVISELRSLQYLYKSTNGKVPLIINEKIEKVTGRPISDQKNGMIDVKTYYHRLDDTHYLTSSIGRSYSSQKEHERPDAWITFGESFYKNIFELAKEKSVKLLDASYNETHFTKLHKMYGDNLPIYHYKPKIKHNPKSVLYLVTTQKGRSNYSKATLGIRNKKVTKNGIYLQSLKPKLETLIKQLQKEGKRVGMITLQELVKDWTGLLGEEMVLYYGNHRGTNLLEKVDVLILLGTMFHPIKTILFDCVMAYHELPENIEAKFDGEKFDGYQDYVLNEFFKIKVMEEMYQGDHRIRPLLHDKIIISLSRLPEKIRDNQEFTIKEMPLNKVCAEVVDSRRYYHKYKDDALEIIVPKGNLDFQAIRESVQNDIFINQIGNELGLSSFDETKQLLLDVFSPMMSSILKCKKWKKKEPSISNVVVAIRKKSQYKPKRVDGKVKRVKQKGYTKNQVYYGIALCELIGMIKIKTIRWEGGRGGEKFVLDFKT